MLNIYYKAYQVESIYDGKGQFITRLGEPILDEEFKYKEDLYLKLDKHFKSLDIEEKFEIAIIELVNYKNDVSKQGTLQGQGGNVQQYSNSQQEIPFVS
jgi:hypothetical protein